TNAIRYSAIERGTGFMNHSPVRASIQPLALAQPSFRAHSRGPRQAGPAYSRTTAASSIATMRAAVVLGVVVVFRSGLRHFCGLSRITGTILAPSRAASPAAATI